MLGEEDCRRVGVAALRQLPELTADRFRPLVQQSLAKDQESEGRILTPEPPGPGGSVLSGGPGLSDVKNPELVVEDPVIKDALGARPAQIRLPHPVNA